MKKKRILLLILAFFMTFIGKVSALEEKDNTCNAVSVSELRAQAANVKISYIEEYETEMTEGEPDDDGSQQYVETKNAYLKIKIYNLTSKLYIMPSMDNVSEEIENPFDGKIFTVEDVGTDGAITIKQKPTTQVINYTFKIVSDEYGCNGKTLRTVKITLPMYNYYADLSICQDIPEYYLCKRYVTFDPSNNPDFEKKVNDYKATLGKQREENKEEDENTISSTLESVSKYKYVIVGVIVAIGVVITVLILRRKRSDKK